jgi:Immunity protein 10
VLLFSQSDTVDEQDSFLGMDTYCVSTDSGATFYGGVESAKVNATELAVRFTPEAAETLGVPRDLLLQFEDEAALTVAGDGLRRVGVAAVSI